MEQEIISGSCWFAFLPVKMVLVQWEVQGIAQMILFHSLYFNTVNIAPRFRIQISFKRVEQETQMKKTTPLKFLKL